MGAEGVDGGLLATGAGDGSDAAGAGAAGGADGAAAGAGAGCSAFALLSVVAPAGELPGALQDARASIAAAIAAHASFRIIACLSMVRASRMFRESPAVPSYRAG
ncbi:MAG: hypothetical protein A3E01_03420 [Gammaproteobacteria bacterium RIFCSPHIGHO2_12_FULL_63_22]|nr:MAG: hypothetical protein A3E01_03420 [Gammaproteobacteria bacterium RIFCSPHIGHO2_12_FULL_63_22]